MVARSIPTPSGISHFLSETLRGRRLLITGGAGFIGSHVVEGAAQHGALVRVLDNLSSGTRANLEHLLARIEFVEGDIRDQATCDHVMRGIELVVHLAAIASVDRSLSCPAETIAVNVTGTANLLQSARNARIARVVYASSSSVYGTSTALPHREGREGLAQSPYAASKQMVEQLATVYSRSFGLPSIGLRFFNVYGPRQAPEGDYAAVVSKFVEARRQQRPLLVHGDGKQSRDFIHVRDVVTATLLALVTPDSGPRAYNLGTGRPTSILELAGTLSALLPGPHRCNFAAARANDIPESYADMTDFVAAFGFRPETTLLEGLRELIDDA